LLSQQIKEAKEIIEKQFLKGLSQEKSSMVKLLRSMMTNDRRYFANSVE